MSEKLPVFSSKEFIRAAKRLGFEIKRNLSLLTINKMVKVIGVEPKELL